MLYIIKKDYFLADYILQAFDNDAEVKVISQRRCKLSLWSKMKKQIDLYSSSQKHLTRFYESSFLQELAAIKETDKVLFWGVENLKDLLLQSSFIKSKHVSAFLWNPVRTINRNAFSKYEYKHFLNKSRIEVCTFDARDAGKYHFRLVKQVYRRIALPKEPMDRWVDFAFVGMDKGRAGKVCELKQLAQAENLSTEFYLVPDKHSKKKYRTLFTDKLSYQQTLSLIGRSRCLVELLQRGQSGMTLRMMEALAYRKKIVTNNKSILKTDYWDDNNIYLLNHSETRWPSLRAFLDAPYHDYPQDLVDAHEVTRWIEQFK